MQGPGPLSTVILAGLWLLHAMASPMPVALPARDVPEDPLSLFTTDFFLNHASRKVAKVLPSSCVFYTFNSGEAAKALSRKDDNKLVTIWDIWTCDFYDLDASNPNNRLRGFIGDPQDKMTYFARMSEAYAFLCSQYATVLTQDVDNIPENGIWGRVEFPTLKRDDDFDPPKGQVTSVTAFTLDQSKNKMIFQRPLSQQNNVTFDFDPGLPSSNKLEECVLPEQVDTEYGFLEPDPNA